jgi:hypothetical protein
MNRLYRKIDTYFKICAHCGWYFFENNGCPKCHFASYGVMYAYSYTYSSVLKSLWYMLLQRLRSKERFCWGRKSGCQCFSGGV